MRKIFLTIFLITLICSCSKKSTTTNPGAGVVDTTIVIVFPNGGESFKVGDTCNIIWTANFSLPFNLLYSIDSGKNWNYIDSVISDTKYSWFVPDSTGKLVLIKVCDFNNQSNYDLSDSTFSIYKDTIQGFNENFDNYQQGQLPDTNIWNISIKSPSYLVVTQNGYNNNGLRFTDPTCDTILPFDSSFAWMMTSVNTTYNKFSFCFYSENYYFDWGIRSVGDVNYYWSSMSWYLRFINGELLYYNGYNEYIKVCNILSDTWYKLDLEIDWANFKYEIIINDTLQSTAYFCEPNISGEIIHLLDFDNSKQTDCFIIDEIRAVNNKGEKLEFRKPGNFDFRQNNILSKWREIR